MIKLDQKTLDALGDPDAEGLVRFTGVMKIDPSSAMGEITSLNGQPYNGKAEKEDRDLEDVITDEDIDNFQPPSAHEINSQLQGI